LDWELENANTRYLTHGYHTYSSKYIPQVPYYLISKLSRKNDLILDNFMGSGTTLVESKILDRNAIGIDINPLACLISKVKTTNIKQPELERISRIAISIKEDILNLRYNSNNNYLLTGTLHPNIPKWFNESVIHELLIIKSRIDPIEQIDDKNFLMVAFSSILRGVSNAANGFGNLMISKQTKVKLKNAVYEKFYREVTIMIERMKQFNQTATNSNIKILNHDTRDLGSILKDQTIDFICTHPPYMASVPYAEYQKLSLWWLGFNQPLLEKKLIGGQRTRTDMPERFFRDMRLTLAQMKLVLRREKYCSIVIGNPIYNGKTWELNKYIKKEAVDLGFAFLKEIVRGRHRSTMGKMKQEFILIFKN
jgi:DNA modification methylase